MKTFYMSLIRTRTKNCPISQLLLFLIIIIPLLPYQEAIVLWILTFCFLLLKNPCRLLHSTAQYCRCKNIQTCRGIDCISPKQQKCTRFILWMSSFQQKYRALKRTCPPKKIFPKGETICSPGIYTESNVCPYSKNAGAKLAGVKLDKWGRKYQDGQQNQSVDSLRTLFLWGI